MGLAKTVHGQDLEKRFHFVPPKNWDNFAREMGCSARNTLPWYGDLPVPEAPKCPSWLLPVSDSMSVRIAQLEDELKDAGWRILTSKPHVILRLGNKACFREYGEAIDMLGYLPAHFTSPTEARYPCVLKPSSGEYGKDTAIVSSAADVAEVASEGFDCQRWVLQELIPGCFEYATSLLVKDGRILETISTRYEYSKEVYVWPHVEELGRETVTVPEAHVATMTAFLREYSGICNFNYKIRGDGRLCIFEINTRIGSDLGCDVPRDMARSFFARLDALAGGSERGWQRA